MGQALAPHPADGEGRRLVTALAVLFVIVVLLVDRCSVSVSANSEPTTEEAQ